MDTTTTNQENTSSQIYHTRPSHANGYAHNSAPAGAAALKQLSTILSLGAAGNMLYALGIYLAHATPQALATGGVLFIALLCTRVAVYAQQHNRSHPAGAWLLASIVIAYGGQELFWAGATWQILLSGLLLLLLIGNTIFPYHWSVWAIAIFSFVFWMWEVNLSLLLPRSPVVGTTFLYLLLGSTAFIALRVTTQLNRLSGRLTTLESLVSNYQIATANLRRQLEELKVLHAVAVAAAEATHEDTLLEEATRLIGETLYPDNFGFLLIDVENEVLRFHPSYRFSASTIPVAHIPLGVGICGQVAENGKARRIADVTREPAFLRIDSAARAELCVPLRSGGLIIGVVNAESTDFDAFTADDERLLMTFAGQLASAIVRLRRTDEIQQQSQELTALYETALATSSLLEPDLLLKRLYHQVKPLLDPDLFVVTLYNAETDDMIVALAMQHDEIVPHLAEGRIPMEQGGLSGWVIETRQPLLIEDLHDKALPVKPRYIGEMRTWLGVPLIAHDRMIGALSVQSVLPNAFNSSQRRFLASLATQVAVALENARLFHSTIVGARQMAILHWASQEITSASVEPERVYAAIHEATCKLMPCEAFIIALLDPVQQEVIAMYLIDKNGRQPEKRVGLNQGLSGRVIATGKPLLISDTRKITDIDFVHYGEPEEVQSALAVPLRHGGKILGMLSTQSYQPKAYTPDDQNILELLAAHAAVALENARLFDETQQRATELAQALKRLEELDTLKNEFIQNVSHEFRTPLAIIRGYAELLEAGDLGPITEDQRQPLAIILRRSQMLAKMVEDLTAILETEAQKSERQVVDMAALVTNLLTEFKINVEKAGLELHVTVETDAAQVYGNPIHLRRVLDNLLGNALKFTDPGGHITVRLRSDAWNVLLEVSDTGIGIPADKLRRVFERFYQVDGSMKRRYPGTGLGLALVKEIVEAHGGKVTVQSDIGAGATFYVSLPLYNGETVSV